MMIAPVNLALLIVLAGTGAAAAPPDPTPAPASAPSTQPSSNDGALPSLDELLGIEDQAGASRGPTASDPNDAALDAVLNPRQAGEAFTQAIGLMDRVSRRIGQEHDLSIATQRLQEDILRKLDQVIASAKQNQGGGGGSSGSSSSSSSAAQQPDQQQARPGDTAGPPSSTPGEESMPAPGSTPRPGEAVAPDGVSWGSLPARIREALSQGISDQYSELYRSVTEQYYKSLAEVEQ